MPKRRYASRGILGHKKWTITITEPIKLVVLISGSGSNLAAIIRNIEDGRLNAQVLAVISNRSDAYGLTIAEQAAIPHYVFRSKDYSDASEFETAISNQIDAYKPNLVVLAGFMKVLSAQFVTQFFPTIVNIHPSLLPKFKGLNTHQRALDAGEQEHGATVHIVTPNLDSGPIIAQSHVKVRDNDTAQSLAERVLKTEHELYSDAIARIADGRFDLESL